MTSGHVEVTHDHRTRNQNKFRGLGCMQAPAAIKLEAGRGESATQRIGGIDFENHRNLIIASPPYCEVEFEDRWKVIPPPANKEPLPPSPRAL